MNHKILEKIGNEIDYKKQEIYYKIINNTIKIGEKKSIETIIQEKINKIPKEKNPNFIEENIRHVKIKEIRESKENISNKIKSLQENIKLLENNDYTRLDLNISLGNSGGREIVDDNIRKSRIKEIKQKKDILENKLIYLDEQVQGLMREEEFNNGNKKFNLKQYLDNFEKDKRDAELREQKWKKDQEQRIKVFEENQKKISEKLKQKADNESLVNSLRKQENYLKKLEGMKAKTKNMHDDIRNLNEMKEEWKKNPISEKQYLFKIAEEEFLRKEKEKKDEEKKKFENELYKIRENNKPIRMNSLNEFKKNYNEKRQNLLYEKEKERLLKKEEILQKNSNLPKGETTTHQKIVEEEKKLREQKEKEKMDKVYTKLKIQQFSKVIQTTMIPRIDDNKRKEIEEKIQSEHQRPKRIEYKSVGRVIFKKSNKDKSVDKSNTIDANNINSNNNNKRSVEKKVPMEKRPDYLMEIRAKKKEMELNAYNTNPPKYNQGMIIINYKT